VGAPFPHARPSWLPPNAAGVLGPRPGPHSQAYPVMYSGHTPPPSYSGPPPSAPPYSFDHAAMIHAAMSNGQYQQQPEWIVDSGASSHVTGKTGNLTSSHSNLGSNSRYIIVGNGSKLPILAVGSVQISSLPLLLQNVLVSPHIVKKFNLRTPIYS
jgi:hypothetical protein